MLQSTTQQSGCIECAEWLDQKVYRYSLEHFGGPLCRLHQVWIRQIETTNETVRLYLSLRQQGIPAQLEKFDGYKTIDIAIPAHRINIEIDGVHHNANADQALKDLQRTYYSFLKGYVTVRIPNSLVEYKLEDAVEYLVKFINARD